MVSVGIREPPCSSKSPRPAPYNLYCLQNPEEHPNHFPLDLRRPKSDTPPTQMLHPEMDSWVGARPLESRKTRLTVVCLIRCPSAASLSRSRIDAERRLRVACELPVRRALMNPSGG